LEERRDLQKGSSNSFDKVQNLIQTLTKHFQ